MSKRVFNRAREVTGIHSLPGYDETDNDSGSGWVPNENGGSAESPEISGNARFERNDGCVYASLAKTGPPPNRFTVAPAGAQRLYRLTCWASAPTYSFCQLLPLMPERMAYDDGKPGPAAVRRDFACRRSPFGDGKYYTT